MEKVALFQKHVQDRSHFGSRPVLSSSPARLRTFGLACHDGARCQNGHTQLSRHQSASGTTWKFSSWSAAAPLATPAPLAHVRFVPAGRIPEINAYLDHIADPNVDNGPRQRRLEGPEDSPPLPADPVPRRRPRGDTSWIAPSGPSAVSTGQPAATDQSMPSPATPRFGSDLLQPKVPVLLRVRVRSEH